MNCRRANSLLSAYIDAELTGEEMLLLRSHLNECPACAAECRSLRETKQIIASLALKTPRADLEQLLRAQAESKERMGPLYRLFPTWAFSPESLRPQERGSTLRAKPLAATVILSVAGFWLASAALDGPTDLPIPASISPYEPIPVFVLHRPTASVMASASYATFSSGPGVLPMPTEVRYNVALPVNVPVPISVVPTRFYRGIPKGSNEPLRVLPAGYAGSSGYNESGLVPDSVTLLPLARPYPGTR